MSSTNKNNKDFDWEEGAVLDDKDYDPVGGVRAQGLPKLNKAVHADPAKRKKQRDQTILSKQSQPYRAQKTTEDGSIIIEETQSGLSESGIEESEAKRLIETGKKIKGLDRFGKKKDD